MHYPTTMAPFCLLLALTPVAKALGQTQDGINIFAGSVVQSFDYSEYNDQGNRLDGERGDIPGLFVEINRVENQWLLAGKFAYLGADVTYSGQTNGGVPVTSVTKQQIIKMELRAERWLGAPRDAALYFGVAHQAWRRDIQPTFTAAGTPVTGLLETYRWWQFFLGTKVMLSESAQIGWLFDVRLTRNMRPTLTVDYSGLYDTSQLDLGERWGFRVAFPWCYEFSRATRLSVEPFAERSAFGRSDATPLTNRGTTIGSVFEPDSVSNNFGLSVGLMEHF